MNPTSIKSIDARLSNRKEEEEKLAKSTLTFWKQDISSPHGMDLESTLSLKGTGRRKKKKKKAIGAHSDLPAAYDDSELFVEHQLQELSAETNIYAPPDGGKSEDHTGFWDQGWFQEDLSEI
jgi:iron uptake system EfeUOB component EfeO/EfeM